MKPMEIFDVLLERVGPRHWWPAENPFEVVVGAILTQNTAWRNVERAISRLRAAKLLDPAAIHRVSQDRLADAIRSSGYFNQKARKLKAFVRFFFDRYGGDIEKMQRQDPWILRDELLALHGIGPETADVILLYALEKPVFVVDTYTRRILTRHGWLDDNATYQEIQAFFMNQLPPDRGLFNEFHALIDFVGHHYCHTAPRCQGCPLQDRLPK